MGRGAHSAPRTLLLSIALTVVGGAPAPAATLTGNAIVIDGDTIVLHGRTIRLAGIDAPEPAQECARADGSAWACGVAAAQALTAFLAAAGPTTCETLGPDRFGREVADCRRADGAQVSAWMVSEGWALGHPELGGEVFAAAERAAAEAERGLWSASFTPPWEWRSSVNPDLAATAALSDEGCAVKGDIGPGGRIYRLPDWPGYAETIIDPADGDRWFCTEGEAMAAGFRAPRG